MAPASLTGGRPPLDVISEELPFDVRVLAEWVLQVWGQARGRVVIGLATRRRAAIDA